jgi:hypothetical protein
MIHRWIEAASSGFVTLLSDTACCCFAPGVAAWPTRGRFGLGRATCPTDAGSPLGKICRKAPNPEPFVGDFGEIGRIATKCPIKCAIKSPGKRLMGQGLGRATCPRAPLDSPSTANFPTGARGTERPTLGTERPTARINSPTHTALSHHSHERLPLKHPLWDTFV